MTPGGKTMAVSLTYYTRNKIGPRMLPWGTPVVTEKVGELALPATVGMFQLVR